VTRQIALEAALTAGLQDPAQYSPEVLDRFKRNLTPTPNGPNAVKITQKQPDGSTLTIAQEKSPLYFTTEGKTCTAAQFGTVNCQVGVELDINCQNSGGVRSCWAAYRVAAYRGGPGPGSNPKIFLANTLGAAGGIGDSFAAADYAVPIPYDLILGKQDTSACDPVTDLAVRGVNRDTGSLTCLKKPQNRCAVGTFAKSVTVDSSHNVEFGCSNPASKLGCDDNYSLYTFQPNSLEAGSSVVGTCVFVGKNTVNWPAAVTPAPAQSISKRVCPTFYNANFNSPCQVVNRTPTSYACPTCLTYYSCPPCDAYGNCSSCSRTIGGETLTNPLNCTQSTSGQDVFAQTTGPTSSSCTCGGGTSWSAQVSISGRCDLAVAQTKPAILVTP
jgi:hypothetical protein